MCIPRQVADGCWRLLAVAVKLIAKTPWKQAQETGQWVKTSLSLQAVCRYSHTICQVVVKLTSVTQTRHGERLPLKQKWHLSKNVSCSGKAQLLLWRRRFFFSGLVYFMKTDQNNCKTVFGAPPFLKTIWPGDSQEVASGSLTSPLSLCDSGLKWDAARALTVSLHCAAFNLNHRTFIAYQVRKKQ